MRAVKINQYVVVIVIILIFLKYRLRNTGSAAANLCAVANGSVDLFSAYGLHSWDIAAGVLLVEEAGGVVLDPTNRELP